MTLDYSRFYARFHPDDPRHFHGLSLLHQRILRPHLPADRDAPILDFGCGRGYALRTVAALGYTNLQGIDADAGQAAFARSQGLNVTHIANSLEFVLERPNHYAAVLLMDVLEHVPRETQPALLRAILQSLRPGGRLICTVPNAASAIAAYWLYNDYTHHTSFTNESLQFLLEECGFARVTCCAVEFEIRPRYLFWLPTPRAVQWWLRCIVRCRQRLALFAELGWRRSRAVVLTPNILAVAAKTG
jgi:SAM-dependent methyltransferase